MTDDARELVDRYRKAPLGTQVGLIVLRLAALLVAKGVLTAGEFEWVMWGDGSVIIDQPPRQSRWWPF